MRLGARCDVLGFGFGFMGRRQMRCDGYDE